MSDGRLTVVTGGDVYLSVGGVRPFLEGSGYEVQEHAATFEELLAAVRKHRPDAVVMGGDIANAGRIDALRAASPDTRIIVVASAGNAPEGADALVPRGSSLSAIASALAAQLVEPAVPSPTGTGASAAPRGPGRLRVLQFVAAAAVALSVGGVLLVMSGGTAPNQPIRAGRATPGTSGPVAPTPGSSSPLQEEVQSSLIQLVSAIEDHRFEATPALAQELVRNLQQASDRGVPVDPLNAQVTSSLRPVIAQVPTEVLPSLRSILDGLMPEVGPRIEFQGDGGFGEVPVGSSSDPQTVAVLNVGDRALQISEVGIAGEAPGAFSVPSGDCEGRTLTPEGSCAIQVIFSPTRTGPQTAELTVSGPEGVAPGAFALEGTGAFIQLLDTDAPRIRCDDPPLGWQGADVLIACTASDAGSGLASAADASFQLSTHVAPGSEDAEASTDARRVCDREGNCAQAGPFGGIHVDQRAPEVTCRQPTHLWQGANVQVHCVSRDGGSGLAAAERSFVLRTSIQRGRETAAARTGARRVCDAVGNCTTVGPFENLRVDRKAPGASCERPPHAWQATNGSVRCSGTDGGSGVRAGDRSFRLTTAVPAGRAEANARTGTRRVCDAVGNCATAGPVAGFRIDRAAPRIVLSGIADGAVLLLHQSAASDASVSCVDAGSGVASCSAPGSIDTSEVGRHSFTATAIDRVGNVGTVSVRYVVTYGVELRYRPSEPSRKIIIRLVDAAGKNVSSSSVSVTAVDIDGSPLHKPFVYSRSKRAYFLTVPGKKDSARHVLHFVARDDPLVHSAPFILGED